MCAGLCGTGIQLCPNYDNILCANNDCKIVSSKVAQIFYNTLKSMYIFFFFKFHPAIIIFLFYMKLGTHTTTAENQQI